MMTSSAFIIISIILQIKASKNNDLHLLFGVEGIMILSRLILMDDFNIKGFTDFAHQAQLLFALANCTLYFYLWGKEKKINFLSWLFLGTGLLMLFVR